MNWQRKPGIALLAAILAFLFSGGPEALSQVSSPEQYVNTLPGVAYVGDEVCRECHEPQYDSYKKTGMGNSLSRPGRGNLFEFTKPVQFVKKELGLTYSVTYKNGKLYHAESKFDANGKLEFSESHPIAFTVGSGYLGRSYLVEKGGALFVSPISYYRGIRGWDVSPGYASGQFVSFSRPAGDLCVSCHSGLSRPVPGSRNRYLTPPFPFLAIGCERCHGPGEIHVRERKANAELKEAVDHSIVNPARLPWPLRDDVCSQCHLAGDARVLRPGKSYLDFRPGTPLSSIVSVFSAQVPPIAGTIKALSHPEQLAMSRCSIASKGKIGCITCHDPHVRLVSGAEAALKFRQKCLTCHDLKSCTFPLAKRLATKPQDNCIQCHMPRRPASNIDHSALTDHRIPRWPAQEPQIETLRTGSRAELIPLIKSESPTGMGPDLRTLALAYFEVSHIYPEFQARGFELLEKAAQDLPNDPDVQLDFGLVLMLARPQSPGEAATAFQRSINAGSKSVEARVRLAKLEAMEGELPSAIRLFKETIQMDPYFTPAYLGLADVYEGMDEEKLAVETLESVLKYEPGNDSARKRLSIVRIRRPNNRTPGMLDKPPHPSASYRN